MCSNDCYKELVPCRIDCETNLDCLIGCDYALSDCLSICPCHTNCSDGCTECLDSPYCVCARDQPNPDKEKCVDEFDQIYLMCVADCNRELACISQCIRDYDENVYNCPCNNGCPLGCPCTDYRCPTSTTETTTATATTTTKTTTTKATDNFIFYF